MRYPFSTHIKDTETGVMTIPDFECDLEISFDSRAGITVDAVYKDGKNILVNGDTLSQQIAYAVACNAEHELAIRGRLYDRVMEREAA